MTDDAKLRWRSVTERQLADSTADAAERVKVQLSLAQDALKALLLANGGALIGLFTFVGNVISKGTAVRFDMSHLWVAFVLFVAGFAMALVAHVFAFLSQDRFAYQSIAETERLTKALLSDELNIEQSAEARFNRQGQAWYAGGLIVAIVSLLLFCCGSGFALAGVQI